MAFRAVPIIHKVYLTTVHFQHQGASRQRTTTRKSGLINCAVCMLARRCRASQTHDFRTQQAREREREQRERARKTPTRPARRRRCRRRRRSLCLSLPKWHTAAAAAAAAVGCGGGRRRDAPSVPIFAQLQLGEKEGARRRREPYYLELNPFLRVEWTQNKFINYDVFHGDDLSQTQLRIVRGINLS